MKLWTDFKNLVIANLSPFRTRKLKAVSVSLFENHADIFPDKQSAAGIEKQKTTYRSTDDSNIDLHEVYADAKYIHKIDEGALVEESSKSKSVVFRFDEFFVAISGYVFLLFAVFTALFMYRMQSSAWATGGDGSVKLGGFCSSCAMEQLQKSFYYPITSTVSPPSMLSTSILRDQPSGASIRSKKRNTSLRNSNINSNEFTSSKPFSETTSLSTIKIIWMNIFFVLKDSTQPTSLFQDTTGTTFTSMRGRNPTAGVYDGEKGANTTTIRDPGSNVGEKHRHPKASTDHIPTVPLSIGLLKAKNAATQVVKIDKEKSRKENRSHLSKLLEKKEEKPTTTELSTVTTSSVPRAGTGQSTGLKRVLSGIKGAANRVVQGVKKFFQKNAKYTNILLAVGLYLILLV